MASLTGGSVPFYLLLLSVLLTPLPFGSYYQWSWAGLGLIVGLLLVLAAIVLVFTRGSLPSQLRALWLPGGLYLSVVAWVALQGVDLPRVAHPVWAEASEILGQDTRRTISLDPYKTWSEFLKMLIYGGIFWLAARYGHDRERAHSALWIMALAGTGYAIYGLVAQFTELGAFLWFHPMPTGDSGVRSTFVNRNMYALYAGFGSLTAVALLLEKFSDGALSASDAHWLDFVRGSSSKVIFLMTCAFFLVVALFLTTSRGGFFAAVLAFATLLISFGHGGAESPRRVALRLSLGVLALVIAGYVIAGGDLGARLSAWEPLGSDGRFLGYGLILEAIQKSPLTGYGAGNALEVFYLYSDGSFWGAFNYSHNIYLGSVVELGLPATLVLFAAIGLVGVIYLKALRERRHDRIFPALGVSILVLIAVHGLVDSPLILPANAATFAFLLGLATAQSVPASSSREEPDRVAPRHREPAGGRGE